jgi:hypothetical protein
LTVRRQSAGDRGEDRAVALSLETINSLVKRQVAQLIQVLYRDAARISLENRPQAIRVNE